MQVRNIHIDQFEDYVYHAFIDDFELVEYYDRSVGAKTTTEAIENVCDKIEQSYPDAKIFGVEIEGEKAGYFVAKDNLLVSFGINVKFREKEYLSKFWYEIQNQIGNDFHAMLYSHNSRAIKWLETCGMKISYDHITILSFKN